jgi:hypothetical protein
MPPDVTCKQCGFQVAIGLHRGQLSSFSPDQLRMKKRCRRASQPDFAYDCPDLGSALLSKLEKEARSALAGLAAPNTPERAAAADSRALVNRTH